MGRKAAYKGHLLADGKNTIIIATEASSRADSDASALPELMNQMENNVIGVKTIAGDQHYRTIEV